VHEENNDSESAQTSRIVKAKTLDQMMAKDAQDRNGTQQIQILHSQKDLPIRNL
jgi:hypothetical protein